MKTKVSLVTFFILTTVLLSTGCKKNKFPKVLHGTWTSGLVAVSGIGYFDGNSVHVYNDDDTYRSDLEFTDPSTNCKVVLYYIGTYSGEDGKIELTPNGGQVEEKLVYVIARHLISHYMFLPLQN